MAEQQAALAADATRLVLYETQKYFKYRPDLNELRDSMLNGMLPDIERVYANHESYDVKETFRAATLRQLGQIYFEAGKFEKARERFAECEAIAIKLHQQGRLSRPHKNLATCDLWIGDTEMRFGNYDVAEQRYRSLIEHRKKYYAGHPKISSAAVTQSMAEAHGRLGDALLRLGKLEEAKPLMQAAVDARRKWYLAAPRDLRAGEELSGTLGRLSKLCEDSGQFQEMLVASKQSLELFRRSAAEKSDIPTIHNLAVALKRMGRQYQIVDDLEQAEPLLRESIDQFELALKKIPDFAETQVHAADGYYFLAKILLTSGRDNSQQCERGLELCDQLLAKSKNPTNRVLKLKLVALSGQVAEATKLADEIAGEHDNALFCLCGAIGYAFAAETCVDPQRQELIDKALQCVSDALELGWDQYVILRTDKDFSLLQELDAYHQLIDAAEDK